MLDNNPCFIGIDVGTQGERAVLLDAQGCLLGSHETAFALDERSREEQSPHTWWEACLHSLQQLLATAGKDGAARVKAIAVTSTSGTIIPINRQHQPLHNAIMYSDVRQAEEGRICREAALQYHPNGYTAFNTSSGLPKMLWFLQQHPELAPQLYKFIHAADFITGRLCGRYEVTDLTNALKSGYDVDRQCWPDYICRHLPLQPQWLQEAAPSGTPLAPIDPALAARLGLPGDVVVTAGMTDGCASQIASGAVKPGDWNTTIGTTLVVKGVTTAPLNDPQGRIYCHRHPEGYWMPGGASNTGADWITRHFKEQLPELEAQAPALIPTPYVSWPLLQQGERFPFIAPQARGFETPGLSPAQQLAAGMEGVAYIERYAYEVIRQLGGEPVKAIYTAGGASNSAVWLTIRANVLNLPLYKMQQVSGAVGAAILAASKTCFGSIMEAAAAMTQVEKQVLPVPALAAAYEAGYNRFIETLIQKGYIPNQQYA